jgi:peptidoglycan hydrolase-like protein with peptidoglycan-binding domain
MKKLLSLRVVAFAALLYAPQFASAGFGDALVGGVVGGVVGSVITNGVYHRGHRGGHRSVHRAHHRRAKAPVESDEMKIQKALKSLGFYKGPIDGQINSFESRTAIKELNRAYEIGDTSYMSPQERDALIYLATLLDFDRNLIAQGTDSRTKMKRVQTALKVLGFYHGKLDGSTGPMTRRSITDYKMANSLGSGSRLGYEEEYRLITTAKQNNDKNIEDTLNMLKHLGSAQNASKKAEGGERRVILEPAGASQPAYGAGGGQRQPQLSPALHSEGAAQ